MAGSFGCQPFCSIDKRGFCTIFLRLSYYRFSMNLVIFSEYTSNFNKMITLLLMRVSILK